MTAPATTVFVVDDDPGVRHALHATLTDLGRIVECYSSAEAFLDAYEPGRSGCLVLDVNMPGMSGLELQAALAERDIHVPIIFVSGVASVADSVRAMKAGAIDFIEKPYSTEILLERIDAALAQAMQRQFEDTLRKETHDAHARLSPREKQVLAVLVETTGSLSSKQIAMQMGISPRTVEHYRASLMSKMRAKSLTDLVLRARMCGIP